jgi:hypothetical protein
MGQQGKTEIELLVLLNDVLRKHDACEDARATALERVGDAQSDVNWDASIESVSGRAVLPDCKRAFIAAKSELQRKYFLLTDD